MISTLAYVFLKQSSNTVISNTIYDLWNPNGGNVAIHELKIMPEYFEAINKGVKTFELRINDRGFNVGDEIMFKEWDGSNYTGRFLKKQVSYILKNYPGIVDGYAILSLKD